MGGIVSASRTLPQHGKRLFDEQRVARCDRAHPRANLLRQRLVTGEEVDQLLGPARRKRVEVEKGATKHGSCLEEVGAAGAEQQNRRPARRRDGVEQVEEGRLGPVQVVESEEQRTLAGERLEEAPRCPAGLLGRAGPVGRPDRRAHAGGDERAVGLAADERLDEAMRVVP